MKNRKIWALLLALCMTFALTACGREAAPSEPPTASPSQEASPSVEPTPEASPSEEPSPSTAPEGDAATVNLAVLSGPTGIGAVKLLRDADSNKASSDKSSWTSTNLYNYTIAADNSELVAGLTGPQPTFDIATVASNVAVNLYNKTNGGVKIIALGTLGVLHILEGGGNDTIHSMADLKGRTIYAVGQGANPEYVLRYLLSENGVDPDNDVELVFADATEVTQKLMSGEAECAMLPVPAATAAILKSEGSIRAALDLTEVWNETVGDECKLVQTAVVARTAFLEEHKDQVDTFLKDYEASIDYVLNHVDDAAELVADYGITPSPAIAKQAIPQCHLTFLSGENMAPTISGYYEILYKADPASVGGALPDDAIYYVP